MVACSGDARTVHERVGHKNSGIRAQRSRRPEDVPVGLPPVVPVVGETPVGAWRGGVGTNGRGWANPGRRGVGACVGRSCRLRNSPGLPRAKHQPEHAWCRDDGRRTRADGRRRRGLQPRYEVQLNSPSPELARTPRGLSGERPPGTMRGVTGADGRSQSRVAAEPRGNRLPPGTIRAAVRPYRSPRGMPDPHVSTVSPVPPAWVERSVPGQEVRSNTMASSGYHRPRTLPIR